MNNFIINAFWDEEAQVWVTESSDVPGLCTEASTLELLSQKIQIMIPELLENLPSNTRVHLEAHRDFALTAA
jgi:predicted RNase H-like HicB family nuclease